MTKISVELSAKESDFVSGILTALLEGDTLGSTNSGNPATAVIEWQKSRKRYVAHCVKSFPRTKRSEFESNRRAHDQEAALLKKLTEVRHA